MNAYRPELSTATLGNVRPPHFFQFYLAYPVTRKREGLLVFAENQSYAATAPEKKTEVTHASELHQVAQRT